MMVSLHIRRVKPDREAQLRQWLAELNARAEEVRETFRAEGVRHEQALILSTSDGPIIIWAAELEDAKAAHAAFKTSKLPIDVEHARVLRECLGEQLTVTPAFDVTL